MDLTITTKSPDTENETPPQTQPIKPLSFANGALKKKHHRQPPPPVVVPYKECLKNHAASLGGHALDGCGEFMSSLTATSTDPTSLKCAACGCHRNFHRREPDESITTATHFLGFHRHPPPPRRTSPSPSPSPSPPPPQPLLPTNNYSFAPHMLLALSTAVPNDSPPSNHHSVATPTTPTAMKGENPSGRKRIRTRFSQEQKEKMFSFSEKLGWKMQKCDEGIVEEFCNEVGVVKGVLKVWMHNNKNTFGKRDTTPTPTATTNSNGNGRVSFDNNGHNINIINNRSNSHHQNESSDVHLHVSTNGSSSTS